MYKLEARKLKRCLSLADESGVGKKEWGMGTGQMLMYNFKLLTHITTHEFKPVASILV